MLRGGVFVTGNGGVLGEYKGRRGYSRSIGPVLGEHWGKKCRGGGFGGVLVNGPIGRKHAHERFPGSPLTLGVPMDLPHGRVRSVLQPVGSRQVCSY